MPFFNQDGAGNGGYGGIGGTNSNGNGTGGSNMLADGGDSEGKMSAQDARLLFAGGSEESNKFIKLRSDIA